VVSSYTAVLYITARQLVATNKQQPDASISDADYLRALSDVRRASAVVVTMQE